MARRKVKSIKVGQCSVNISKDGGKYVVQTRIGNVAISKAVPAIDLPAARSAAAAQVRHLRRRVKCG